MENEFLVQKKTVSNKKVFISAYVSNVLEVYDFIITGTLIPYISPLYFPMTDKISILMAGSLTYLIGFLMRPLGAIFFGHIGDIYGRKKALLASIFGMAMATFCIGILPVYGQIGQLAPLILIALRCIQGFCLGGEGQGANVLVLEQFKDQRPGLVGALLATSNGSAALLSFAIGMLVTSNNVPAYAWRFCYIFGASLALMGFYLRTHAQETVFPAKIPNHQKRFPIITLFKENRENFISVFLCCGMGSALTLTGFTFINILLTQFLNFSSQKSFTLSIIGTFIAMISVIIGGQICDKYGAVKVLKWSLVFSLIMLIPIHLLFSTGNIFLIILGFLLLGIATGGIAGTMPHYIASSFPKSERYTGAALSNNLAQAFLGGIQPVIALYLIKKTNYLWSPALYTVGISGLCLIFLYLKGKKITTYSYNS